MARGVISEVWRGKQPRGRPGPALSASPGQWQDTASVTVSTPGAWLVAMLVDTVCAVGSDPFHAVMRASCARFERR